MRTNWLWTMKLLLSCSHFYTRCCYDGVLLFLWSRALHLVLLDYAFVAVLIQEFSSIYDCMLWFVIPFSCVTKAKRVWGFEPTASSHTGLLEFSLHCIKSDNCDDHIVLGLLYNKDPDIQYDLDMHNVHRIPPTLYQWLKLMLVMFKCKSGTKYCMVWQLHVGVMLKFTAWPK